METLKNTIRREQRVKRSVFSIWIWAIIIYLVAFGVILPFVVTAFFPSSDMQPVPDLLPTFPTVTPAV